MFDFKVHFPNADSDGFLKNWPAYGSRMEDVLKSYYGTNVYTEWPCEIEQVLSLLKVLPAKAGPKSKSPVLPFNQVIDKLIFHSEVQQ